MTKKDYELIASVIKNFLDDGYNDQLDGIAGVHVLTGMLADAFKSKNKHFDSGKFFDKCGIEDEKIIEL